MVADTKCFWAGHLLLTYVAYFAIAIQLLSFSVLNKILVTCIVTDKYSQNR